MPIQKQLDVVIVPWVLGLDYFCHDQAPPKRVKNAGTRAVFKIFGFVGNVFEAKAALAQLFEEGFHPLTHPEVVRTCVDVSDWADRWGKLCHRPISESELRHIQKQWGVAVWWESEYECSCRLSSQYVLLGLESAVRRASIYISKLVRADMERLEDDIVENRLFAAAPIKAEASSFKPRRKDGTEASSVKSCRKDDRRRLSWSARACEWEMRRLRRRQQRLRKWAQGLKLRSTASEGSL